MKRKLLVPEVVQTSSLDCGPAALKALLDGFGKHVSYGQLREICQTGLDGTSIETIEIVANQMGLEAEQIMLPLDHLLLPESHTLPAIVIVTLAQGLTHFVVLWRRIGNWLQIMDPSIGRRWLHARTFLNEVYQHTMPVGANDWFEYASSDAFQAAFKARQRALNVDLRTSAYDNWRELATQDAALRLMNSLRKNGALTSRSQIRQMLERLVDNPDLIPANCWSVTQGQPDEILMRGAVLVRVKSSSATATATFVRPTNPVSLPLGLAFLLPALLAASTGAFIEALLFRSLLDVNSTLAIAGQRLAASLAVLIFCCALLLLELPAFATGARLGRILENRLRIAFLEKIPKLTDRYFQSRPISDMAERSHILHRMRHLPDQLRQLTLSCSQLVISAAGVVWLEPKAWPFALASLAASLIPWFSSHWLLAERDLRIRTHSGGLMRFYLDAMLGLMPIRAHGAAASICSRHGDLLAEWTSASFRLQRAIVLSEGLQLCLMFGLVAALFLSHPLNGVDAGRVLLMAYWALNMPALGQDIAVIARQYPNYRSIALRLLEPLRAPEEQMAEAAALPQAPAIEYRNIHVIAAGTSILTDVSATLSAGSHVAVVGPSGAGKSTLVGLLLGWLKPSSGELLISGKPLDIEQIRLSAAWVDPTIQIWNETLHSNLLYGGGSETHFAETIDAAALRHVLETLPRGLQTVLGENGGLVSGGEGQRVRLARALQRRNATIVILDEPFRGLDRDKRHELLVRARQYWADATLICVTHDVSETLDFNQVLIVETGAIVESGPPSKLAADSQSRYACLLAAEEQTRTQVWKCSQWRHIRLDSGSIA